MTINTAAATAKLRGLTAKFDIGYKSVTPFYPQLCTVTQSSGHDERMAALGSVGAMREWLSDRVYNQLRSVDFTLVNRNWENSVEAEKKDIEDDRLSMYAPVAQMLGMEAGYHPDSLVFDTMVAGTSALCWDGTPFYGTSHVFGKSGTQSNLLESNVGTPAAPTEAEFRTAYSAARTALLGFKRDNGQTFVRNMVTALDDLILFVPTGLQEIATQALMKSLISSGETNLVLDRPKAIYALPGLTDQVSFYLHRVGQPLKPFLFQRRQALRRSGWLGWDDPREKKVQMTTDARYAAGYYAWWNSVKVTLT